MTFDDVIKSLKDLKKQGYIKTHRKGQTGIGKTLEDLLGIDENNIPAPNCVKAELKSARKNASNMITLFTKSPLPQKANTELLQKYGYFSSRGNKKKELHTTVTTLDFNNLKGKPGFKIDIEKDKINLLSFDKKIVGYWDKETLKTSFETKLPMLIYVKADSRGSNENEEFWFNEVWLLSKFNFKNFTKLLKEGIIKVDIRIGQYPDGRTHDHGTGFRVFPNKLDLCFKKRKKIV